MSDGLTIDIDSCRTSADNLRTVAVDLDQSCLDAKNTVSSDLSDISAIKYSFKLGLTSIMSAGSRRVHGLRLLLDDVAEFLDTNATLVELHEADSANDLQANSDGTYTVVESVILDGGEYTDADFHEIAEEASNDPKNPVDDPDAPPSSDNEFEEFF